QTSASDSSLLNFDLEGFDKYISEMDTKNKTDQKSTSDSSLLNFDESKFDELIESSKNKQDLAFAEEYFNQIRASSDYSQDSKKDSLVWAYQPNESLDWVEEALKDPTKEKDQESTSDSS